MTSKPVDVIRFVTKFCCDLLHFSFIVIRYQNIEKLNTVTAGRRCNRHVTSSLGKSCYFVCFCHSWLFCYFTNYGKWHAYEKKKILSCNFCHAMLCKRGLCRHAMSITFVNSTKTSNRIVRIFSPSGRETILGFRCQTAWQYSDGDPLMGGGWMQMG